MYHILKHKFFRYIVSLSVVLSALTFSFLIQNHQAFAVVNTGTPTTAAATANPSTDDSPTTGTSGLCFYQPTGTLYNCSDVSPSETLNSSDCYTNDGTVDTPTPNGPQQLHWTKADCSASEFQGTPFANCSQIPATDGQAASNTCALPVSGVGTGSDGDSVCSSSNTGCAHIVTGILNPVIDFLSAGVGIIIVVMIIIGGIQYITSQDNPQAVSSAKNRIFNAIVALVLFALMWSLLEWLVPGGIF